MCAEISVRMGSTEVGARLSLPLQTRGRVQLAFFDVFRSKRSMNTAGLSYRCLRRGVRGMVGREGDAFNIRRHYVHICDDHSYFVLESLKPCYVRLHIATLPPSSTPLSRPVEGIVYTHGLYCSCADLNALHAEHS